MRLLIESECFSFYDVRSGQFVQFEILKTGSDRAHAIIQQSEAIQSILVFHFYKQKLRPKFWIIIILDHARQQAKKNSTKLCQLIRVSSEDFVSQINFLHIGPCYIPSHIIKIVL